MGEARESGRRLRLARQARGLTQQQLADIAGIARQTLSGIEAGLSDPSLRNAMALAGALGMTVEEIFEPASSPPSIAATPVAPLGSPGARVALGSMGDGFVALPLRATAAAVAGFLPASGVAGADGTAAEQRQVHPIGLPRPSLVIAGCDPALPLLEQPLGLHDPPLAFRWWSCPSRVALGLAADGLVHVAGIHLRGSDGRYNTRPAAELLPEGGEVIGFSSWREGLVLRPDLAGSVHDVGDVARLGLRLVNQGPGAEARNVLDRELTRLGIEPGDLSGYHTQAAGHLHTAAAIAAGLADAGITSEPAALAYGLAFIPLATERFDLVIPADQIGTSEIQALLKVLSSRWLLGQLASLPGYDPARCGEHIATLPPAQRRGRGTSA